MFKYELGQELKDIVTGFSGIVMCRSEYFTGCKHYGLASKALSKEGKVNEWEYFDESRLVLVSKKKFFRPRRAEADKRSRPQSTDDRIREATP